MGPELQLVALGTKEGGRLGRIKMSWKLGGHEK